MSHELRTPLNGILGYAQIFKRDASLTAKHHADAETIERSGQHLLTLINDILDLAKVEAGKVELVPEDVELRPLLRDVSALIRIKAEHKSVTFHEAFADDLPRAVHADAHRLRQILLNLLGNAVKFTEQGTVTLRAGRIENYQLTSENLTHDVRTRHSSLVNFQLRTPALALRRRMWSTFSTHSGKPAHRPTGCRAPGWGWRLRVI